MAYDAVQLIEDGFRARHRNVDVTEAPYSNKAQRQMFRAWFTGWIVADREIFDQKRIDTEVRAREQSDPRKVVSIRR